MEERREEGLEMRLELVHFQLTKNCNLRCWFCGQWGKKGFFADSMGMEMRLEDWLEVTDSLKSYKDQTGQIPTVVLWGGEPLLYPHFDELAWYLSEAGFPLELVTNGTLLDRHREVCRECFRTIYLSVDGPERIHDDIRGRGVFMRVLGNRRLLYGGKAKLNLMSVLTDATRGDLPGLVRAMEAFRPDQLLLQEMIGLTREEIISYQNWMQESFGHKATDIEGWETGPGKVPDKSKEVRNMLPELQKLVDFPVSYLPHGIATGRWHCLSPWRHAHVAWNGEVLYCTDFYDFSAGNVHHADLLDIFTNGKSERFRQEILAGRCVTCEHCSWRNSTEFG